MDMSVFPAAEAQLLTIRGDFSSVSIPEDAWRQAVWNPFLLRTVYVGSDQARHLNVRYLL